MITVAGIAGFIFFIHSITSRSAGTLNEKEIEICDCVKMATDLQNEMINAGDDETELKKVQEKFKELARDCEKLGEGKSDDELRKLVEEAGNCL